MKTFLISTFLFVGVYAQDVKSQTNTTEKIFKYFSEYSNIQKLPYYTERQTNGQTRQVQFIPTVTIEMYEELLKRIDALLKRIQLLEDTR